MTQPTTPDTPVDIEKIMQEIRQQIVAQKAGGKEGGQVRLTGKHLPPQFYEHLYQAELAYDQLSLKLHVTKSTLPIIGPFIDRLRTQLHELVLFYVNRMAIEQIGVNEHLLRCINILAAELEQAYDKIDAQNEAS